MNGASWDPYQTVVLEGGEPNIAFPESKQPGSAHITAETPLDLTIAVESPDGGMLVVADSDYPGWSATLDGSSTTIYRANLAFRAVAVPPGTHTVTMSYQPRSFMLGLIASALSLAVCGILIAVALIRQRRGLRPA